MNNAHGGAAESTVSIIEGLQARGVESSVVCHHRGDGSDAQRLSDLVDGRCHFQPLWSWNRRVRSPVWRRLAIDLREGLRTGRGHRSVRAVTQAARFHDVDLVHSNTVLVPEGAWAARALGLPHVWHLRELMGPGHPFRFWREHRFVPDRLMPAGEVVVANSQVATDVARAMTRPPASIDEHRWFVVHNGIEVERFANTPPPAHDGPVVVGMVANLTSRWKQHELFIEAVATIETSLPASYVIVGIDPHQQGRHDPYAAALHRRVVELGLASRFEFLGHIGEPARAVSAVDVLVHPCAQESFGRVAVEAMAAGRPVVAVDAGGIGEVVEHERTGLLVPPDDPVALGEAIRRLVVDPAERATLGAAGPVEARARFGNDAMVDGVVAAYRRALSTVPASVSAPHRRWFASLGRLPMR